MVSNISELSLNNTHILKNIAQEQLDCFSPGKEEKQEGFWASVSSFFPSSEKVGQQVGRSLAIVHGPVLCNKVVDIVMAKFYPQPKQENLSFFQRMKQTFLGASQTALIETAKLTFTSQVMPIATALGASAGGVTLPTALLIISAIYHKVMQDPQKLEKFKSLALQDLVKINAAGDPYTNGLGEEINLEDLEDLRQGLYQYDLAVKLLELQPKQIRAYVFEHYLIQRSDDQIILPNGKVATTKEVELIQKVVGLRNKTGLLERNNPTQNKESIKAFIQLLAENQPQAVKQEEKSFIYCEDGSYCATHSFTVEEEQTVARGRIFHMEQDIQALEQAKWEQEVAEIAGDFVEIKSPFKVTIHEAAETFQMFEEYEPKN